MAENFNSLTKQDVQEFSLLLYEFSVAVRKIQKESTSSLAYQRKKKEFEKFYKKIKKKERFVQIFNILVSINYFQQIGTITVPISYEVTIIPESDDVFDFSYVFGTVYHYLITQDKKSLKAFIKTLPIEIRLLLSFSFGRRMMTLFSESFILQYVTKLYSVQELLRLNLFKIPIVVESDLTEKLSASVSKNEEFFELPALLFLFPKSIRNRKSTQLCIFLKDGVDSYSTIPAKYVKNYLKLLPLTTFGVIGFYVRRKDWNSRHLFVPVYFSENLDDVKNLFQGKNYEVNLDDARKNLRKFRKIMERYKPAVGIDIQLPTVKLVESYSDLENFHFSAMFYDKKMFFISRKGMFKLKLTEEIIKVKVVDYFLDEETFEAKGVIVKFPDGELKTIKTYIPQKVIDEGIANLFAQFKIVKLKNVPLKVIFSGLGVGYYRECHLCGKLTKNSYKGFCYSCFSKLEACVESHINDFEIKCKVYSPFTVQIDKYKVVGIPDKIIFKINYSEIKGKQLKLPLGDPEKCECADV